MGRRCVVEMHRCSQGYVESIRDERHETALEFHELIHDVNAVQYSELGFLCRESNELYCPMEDKAMRPFESSCPLVRFAANNEPAKSQFAQVLSIAPNPSETRAASTFPFHGIVAIRTMIPATNLHLHRFYEINWRFPAAFWRSDVAAQLIQMQLPSHGPPNLCWTSIWPF
ncbi:hypothetical protein Ae201684P_002474 [Aphanomyces euteiches]|nr:hypothetical protein Ae201684P_002474 [Aphanomyces euteiches]